MLQQNTVVVTMVCVLVAVLTDHTLTTFVTRFSSPSHLAHEVADYVKCASYCLITLLLQITLRWYFIKQNRFLWRESELFITMECITGKHFLHKDNVVVQEKFNFTECFITLVFVEKKKKKKRICAHTHTHMQARAHAHTCTCVHAWAHK